MTAEPFGACVGQLEVPHLLAGIDFGAQMLAVAEQFGVGQFREVGADSAGVGEAFEELLLQPDTGCRGERGLSARGLIG